MAEKLNNGDLKIRRMKVSDIPLGMKLKTFAGWNQVEQDWEMFLATGNDHFVASLKDTDVGTVVTVPYSDHFAWIGMVLVDPDARRKGVGTALLKKSIEAGMKISPVRLDATAEGYELYKTLGFSKEYELVRMVRKSRYLNRKNTGSRHIQKNILNDLVKYDTPIFGAGRQFILEALFDRNPEYGYYHPGEQVLDGYCLGRHGSKYEQIGPVVAEKEEIAIDLTLAALSQCAHKDIVLDAFMDKPDWISFLKEIGFVVQRKFIRMCLGELNYPGITDKQFAMAGPEIG